MNRINVFFATAFLLASVAHIQGGSLEEIERRLQSGQCVAFLSHDQIEFWVADNVPAIIDIPKFPRKSLSRLYIFEETPRGVTKHKWYTVIDGFVHVRPSKNGEMHYLIKLEEIKRFIKDPDHSRLNHKLVQPHELIPLLEKLIVPARLTEKRGQENRIDIPPLQE